MKLLNFFKKKELKDINNIQEVKKQIGYNDLIEITKILTENNQEAIGAIRLLVHRPLEFKEKFYEWLYEYELSPEDAPDVVSAFLLTGSNVESPYDFGAYSDWKEEGQEIIWSLKASIINKKYPIDLEKIQFSYDECGEDAIKIISDSLEPTNYSLIIWLVDGDCYHLFIIPQSKWEKLYELGENMQINFRNTRSK